MKRKTAENAKDIPILHNFPRALSKIKFDRAKLRYERIV